jgi:UDP-3-O-[3-hydroxymyristoyl] glucosamine N-acyltransferase
MKCLLPNLPIELYVTDKKSLSFQRCSKNVDIGFHAVIENRVKIQNNVVVYDGVNGVNKEK